MLPKRQPPRNPARGRTPRLRPAPDAVSVVAVRYQIQRNSPVLPEGTWLDAAFSDGSPTNFATREEAFAVWAGCTARIDTPFDWRLVRRETTVRDIVETTD